MLNRYLAQKSSTNVIPKGVADPATLKDLEKIFGNVVGALLALAGVSLFIMLIVGGFKYITAGGDPKGIDSAKKTITYAIGGMVLIAAGYLILVFIKQFTGVDVTIFKIVQ